MDVDKWELICDFHCLDLILRSFLYLRSARKKKLFFVFPSLPTTEDKF